MSGDKIRPTTDPWTWLHDNDFSWDDVNAVAAILGEAGYEIVTPAPDGLDVERLATAMNRVSKAGGVQITGWGHGEDSIPAQIAREYARLAPEPTP